MKDLKMALHRHSVEKWNTEYNYTNKNTVYHMIKYAEWNIDLNTVTLN